MSADTWYKRDPQAFLGGVQGMGPELIGAYAVILDILYARNGDMPRDDRHLSGVLGCSIRKARALTEQLIALEKIKIVDGRIVNRKASEIILDRKKQRENYVKPTRSERENGPASNENSGLARQIREDKNITPLTPQGGPRRKFGVPENVIRLLNGEAS